eukprot:2802986-Amphidinium_carterae.1
MCILAAAKSVFLFCGFGHSCFRRYIPAFGGSGSVSCPRDVNLCPAHHPSCRRKKRGSASALQGKMCGPNSQEVALTLSLQH